MCQGGAPGVSGGAPSTVSTGPYGMGVAYSIGHQGPRDYQWDRSRQTFTRPGSRGGAGSGAAGSSAAKDPKTAARVGPTSKYANRPIAVAVASGTEPIPLQQLSPVLLGTTALYQSSTLG